METKGLQAKCISGYTEGNFNSRLNEYLAENQHLIIEKIDFTEHDNRFSAILWVRQKPQQKFEINKGA